MKVRRKAIAIPLQEVEILKGLYLEFRIPSDQYKRRPHELRRFVDTWNMLTDRSDEPGEILHFIITKRKQQLWPRFDGTHKRLESMPEDFLSGREWAHLEAVYLEVMAPLELGSDNLAFDEGLAAKLSREFHKRTGKSVYGRLLFAAIESKRKRGDWVKVSDKKRKTGFGFSDIDQIAS